MKIIEGGVCAAKGFKAGSVRCGVKESRTNDDTAIIFSECECTAAATYTMNRVKAAPLYVTMEHLEDGVARAIVANAGNANACAPDGMENARRMAKAAAQLLGVAETDVAVASTGVIGQRLNIECIEEHLPELKLEDNASEKANRAIMTTDTKPKTAAVEFTIGGKTCRIGGICKGRGADGGYRQGLRHDSSEHGHHAVLHHDRLRYHARNADRRPAGERQEDLQPRNG